MIRHTFIGLIFTFSALGQPTGSVKEGPSSIRSFKPLSTAEDDAIETYFKDAGPLAIEFYEHLTLLANPWLGGRQPGSHGSKIAGEYIVWNLSNNALTPAFDDSNSWYQPFEFSIDNASSKVIKSFVTIEDMALIDGRDYVVLGNSGSGDINAPLTFVGYAIEESEQGYSSFEKDTDLTGQIAVMLRYEPLDENGASQWAGRRFSPHANIREKMQAVIKRGAIGVILLNPPNNRDGRRGLETRSSRFGTTNVPVVQLSEDAMNKILGNQTVAELQKKADAGEIKTENIQAKAGLLTVIDSGGMLAQNIGGVLKGKGELANEWVIIGGHYDHVGYGYTGTRYPGQLHHGADDNASGSALVMMMARMLSEYYELTDDESLRSVLFLFFDAEEAGLHGSDYFVNNPTINLEQANLMINLDMVGNLSDNNIFIGGSGTATEFETLLPELMKSTSMTASLMPGGTGPSDHTNFYNKDMPVLFFFTGLTDEYHTPKDQAFTTNPAGAARLAKLVHATSQRVIDDPRLTFATSASSSGGNSSRSARAGAKVRLGIHPSYTSELETGILLEGVSEGTSAQDAGLQTGDVLLAWEKTELTGGMKLMELLRTANPGDKVTFLVQRDGSNIEINVTLKAP